MAKKKLKLFVWDDYAPDYSPGLAFAIAEDSEQARDMIEKDVGYRNDSLSATPDTYDLTTPVVYACSGGG